MRMVGLPFVCAPDPSEIVTVSTPIRAWMAFFMGFSCGELKTMRRQSDRVRLNAASFSMTFLHRYRSIGIPPRADIEVTLVGEPYLEDYNHSNTIFGMAMTRKVSLWD
jgi:hypothetical protein